VPLCGCPPAKETFVKQRIYRHNFDNGLVLLAEEMPWLESAAMALLVPAGAATDPEARLGLANFTCEMVQRGCGERNSRQVVEALDRLGVERSASVGGAHVSFGAALQAQHLEEVLSIYADTVRRPLLPDDQLDDARQVCLQEIRAAEDDPAHKVMDAIRDLHYPAPWGRASQGRAEDVQAIGQDDVRRFFERQFVPRGSIVSVAGKIEWDALRETVARLFADWPDRPVSPPNVQPPAGGCRHLPYNSSQTHLAIAYPNAAYRDADYFQARGAVGVLSDGMSSRLFTEVRENLGLCYTVYASCHSLKEQGAVFCYAGTSADRAQETLDVVIRELKRIAQGIHHSELVRLKARIKSALIFQQESSASRSMSMASDWYHRGRVLSLQEVAELIDGLTVDSINAYLAQHPPGPFTIATIGPQPLEVHCDLS
jgi:predicted Zn-dependent peptidase